MASKVRQQQSSLILLLKFSSLFLLLAFVTSTTNQFARAEDLQSVESAPVVNTNLAESSQNVASEEPTKPIESSESSVSSDSGKVSSLTDKNSINSSNHRAETLIAAESASQESTGNEASNKEPIQSAEANNQEQVQQVTEDIPAVSGLTPDEPSQQQQQQQQQNSLDDQNQTLNSNSQQQEQQNEQQTIVAASAGSGRGEQEQSIKANQVNENETPTQFGRKSVQQQSTATSTTVSDFGQSKTNQSKGARSMKRAFGGHLGIFGRKRAQTEEQQQQNEQPATSTTRAPTKSNRNNNNHYYYQTVSTSAPKTTKQPQLKLKNADFPDYREILVQPDQAERQREQQRDQQREQQQSNNQEQNEAKQQPIEQQKVEQGQVNEAEVQTEQSPELNQQQQETLPPIIGDQQTTDGQQSSGDNQQQQQQLDSNIAQPYIRLSNIATINSTTGGSGNSSANGEMKLMRIYVIDLDQKLIVGGAGAQSVLGTSSSSAASGDNQTGNLADSLPQIEQQYVESSQQQSTNSSSPLSSSIDQYTKASDSQSTYTAPPTVTSAPTTVTEQLYGMPKQYQSQEQPQTYQPQQQQQQNNEPTRQTYEPATGTVPDGYVLVDREQLNGNLSQLVAQINQNSNHYGIGSNSYSRGTNYTIKHIILPQQYQSHHQQYQPQQSEYLPYEPQNGGHYSNHYASTNNYSNPMMASSAFGNGKNSISYPVQVQHQMDQQHPAQPQQQQVYQSVPQYIAPQYNGKPETDYEMPQQQSYGGAELPAHYHPNTYTAQSNYSSGSSKLPSVVVQTPILMPQIRPQQYNKSAYPQSQDALPYQQTQMTSYAPMQQSLSQEQQQSTYNYNNEQNYSAKPTQHPATMALTIALDQRWRPLDYAAPSSMAQGYSNYSGNPQMMLNGYKDHDVVSLGPNATVTSYRGHPSNSNYGPQSDQSQYGYNSTEIQQPPVSYNSTSASSYGQAKKSQYNSSQQYGYSNNNNSTATNYTSDADFETNSPMPIYFASSPGESLSSYQSNGNATTQHSIDYDTNNSNSYGQPDTSSPSSAYSKVRANQQKTHTVQQQMSRPQHSTGPYLAVSGTPVSDGVYEEQQNEQEEQAGGEYQQVQQQQQQQATRNRAQGKYKQRGNNRGPKNTRYRTNSNKQYMGVKPESGELNAAYTLQPTDYFQQEINNQQAANQQATDMLSMEQPQPPLISTTYNSMQQRPAQQSYNMQRPMQMLNPQYYQQQQQVGGYYRPMSGAKGLLSWETISSAASSAAKRLPSLSSILMPFSSSAPKNMYPTANYPSPTYGMPSASYQPSKSVHYDRDVSAFHRPYPLRYMNQHYDYGSGGQSAAAAASSSSSEEQNSNSDGNDSAYGGEEQAAHMDLNSSGSSDSQGPDATDSADDSANSEQQEMPKVKLQLASGSNTTSQNDKRVPSAEITDLADINPDTVGKPNKNSRRPAAGKSVPNKRPGAKQPLDSAHVAVLSSIEQQLGTGTGSQSADDSIVSASKQLTGKTLTNGQASRPRKHKKRPPSEFAESNISGLSSGEPISIDSLSAEQQRLLIKGKQIVGSPATGVIFPPSGPPESGDMPMPSSPGRLPQPLGSLAAAAAAAASRPPSSVQIGQYKITPQTQFVQSIIEPSRQMIGQYFKQYIGQLGQFAGR